MTTYDLSTEEKLDEIKTLITATNGYVDGLETLITATNTAIADVETAIAALPTAPTYTTLKGFATVDTTLYTAPAGGSVIVYALSFLSTTAVWYICVHDGTNYHNILPPITNTTGASAPMFVHVPAGETIRLNEISGTAICYYVITYYDL